MPSLLVQLSARPPRAPTSSSATSTVGPRAVAPAVTPIPVPNAEQLGPPYGRAVQKARAARLLESRPAVRGRDRRRALGRDRPTRPAGVARRPPQRAPGLDEVPLTFKFGGAVRRPRRLLPPAQALRARHERRIAVQGRLITIDSLKFTSTSLPSLEADVTATVYLTPKDEGATAGATSSGPQAAQSAAIAAVSSSPRPARQLLDQQHERDPMNKFFVDTWNELRSRRLWPVAVVLVARSSPCRWC